MNTKQTIKNPISTQLLMVILALMVMLVTVPAVNGSGAGTTLSAEKTATGIWTRTYSWQIEKSVNPEQQTLCVNEEGAVEYIIVVTKSDTYTEKKCVSGTISVTNGGAVATENLKLVDRVQYKSGAGPFQDLPGASQTITPAQLAPGQTGTYNYEIVFTPMVGYVYKNVVKVTITNHSGNLGVPFGPEPKADFSLPTVPTLVNDCVQVDDVETMPGLTLVSTDEPEWPETICASKTYIFTKTVIGDTPGTYYIYDTASVATTAGNILDEAEAKVTIEIIRCGQTIEGAKFYDTNANGTWDEDEPPIEGWKVRLTGPDVDEYAFTDADGGFKFENLLPGSYTVEEIFPQAPTWVSTTNSSFEKDLAEGENYVGPDFGNVCLKPGCGGKTIGFWGNKNGQSLITLVDIKALNCLHLYKPAGYTYPPFSAILATAKEQIKTHLQVANAKDMRWMLSAQLIATKLNLMHGFLDGSTIVYLGPLGFMTIDEIVGSAQSALSYGPECRDEQEFWKNLLDGLNNNKWPFVSSTPCPVEYPVDEVL